MKWSLEAINKTSVAGMDPKSLSNMVSTGSSNGNQPTLQEQKSWVQWTSVNTNLKGRAFWFTISKVHNSRGVLACKSPIQWIIQCKIHVRNIRGFALSEVVLTEVALSEVALSEVVLTEVHCIHKDKVIMSRREELDCKLIYIANEINQHTTPFGIKIKI
jgi:hypothetical protein